MQRFSRLPAVACVFAAGAVAGVFFGGSSPVQGQAAAPPPASAPGRYQATSYGNPGGSGVYVVDTHTGEVFTSSNGQKLESIGKPVAR